VSTVQEFGFDRWAAELDAAGRNIGPEVEKVTSKTLLEMKKHAAKIVRGHKHIKHLGRSFNYDVTDAAGFVVVGEVGADHDKKQATLDHFIENGGLHNAPIPHWGPAAEVQVPLWERYLEEAAEAALNAG
jgi:hypothetical protein